MRSIVAALFVLALGLAPAGLAPKPVHAQEVAEADRAAVVDVIRQQLLAFQRDDGAAAFAHAAPNVQAMFGSADVFMRMVRETYQPVYRPREVSFEDIAIVEGTLVQRVLLVGPDGLPVMAHYIMVESEGVWRIAGCILVRVPGVAT